MTADPETVNGRTESIGFGPFVSTRKPGL